MSLVRGFVSQQITAACRVREMLLLRGNIICDLEKHQSVPEKSDVQERMSLVGGTLIGGIAVNLWTFLITIHVVHK